MSKKIIWTGDNMYDVIEFSEGSDSFSFHDDVLTIDRDVTKCGRALLIKAGEEVHLLENGKYHTSEFDNAVLDFAWYMGIMSSVEFKPDLCGDCGGCGLRPVDCCSGYQCGCMGREIYYEECAECDSEEITIDELIALSIKLQPDVFIASCQTIYKKQFEFSTGGKS